MEKSPEVLKALKILDKFTSDQCCGKCISCREGTRQMQHILSASETPVPSGLDMHMLTLLGNLIDHTARCGLGKSIARQVMSVLDGKGEAERIIEEYLPGPYQELLFFQIDPVLCKGCLITPWMAWVGQLRAHLEQPLQSTGSIWKKSSS